MGWKIHAMYLINRCTIDGFELNIQVTVFVGISVSSVEYSRQPFVYFTHTMYLSLKTINAEILVHHSKKKSQYFFFFLIYVYSYTQINWQEKINFLYGFMFIKSDIFYSFGNSRSTFPYFFFDRISEPGL